MLEFRATSGRITWPLSSGHGHRPITGTPQTQGFEYVQPGEDRMASRSGTPRCKRDSTTSSKSYPDRARNVTQIRTDHWRSAIFLKKIQKRGDDSCWFCQPERAGSGLLGATHSSTAATPGWWRYDDGWRGNLKTNLQEV